MTVRADAEATQPEVDETGAKPAPAVTADTFSISNIASTITISAGWLQLLYPTSKCVRADGSACAAGDMTNATYKQIVILPTGYTSSDYSQYWDDFDTVRNLVTHADQSWSTQYASRLIFVGYWLPGNPLGPTANFGAYIGDHPVRGYALTLSNDAVYSKVADIKASALTTLNPIGTLVLFNAIPDQSVTANAAPPSFTGKPFGIAKATRKDLGNPYVVTHELAHASMNFLDEYVEQGLEETNMRSFDVATPLVLFDGSWSSAITAISNLFGVYSYEISEMLAANGNVNIALQAYPSTVGPGSEYYPYEGGMFTGRGTFHAAGSNLMNGNHVMRGPDDGFAYAHSSDQQSIINLAFAGSFYRVNNRLRTAGPVDGWPLELGSSTHVMMYDGDKLNHFQGTQKYTVQVGWYDRVWDTCWWGFVPYPCYTDVWRTAQKDVFPVRHTINLPTTSAYAIANLLQSVACGIGITTVGSFKLCDQPLNTVATNFLPTLSFPMPYEETDVPASQWFTNYWWRFRTWNGPASSNASNWTGWSNFYRSF
jgi:hypothetical protein